MQNKKIDGYNVQIDVEKLAQEMAVNYIDWPAFIGKAQRIADNMESIIKIEKELF